MSRRGPVAAAVVTVVLVGGLTACGGGNGSADRPSRTSGTAQPSDGAAAYVGLTKTAAIAQAEAAKTPWRITREDGETFLVTQDYDPGRLNFEIDQGTVTRATYG